MNRPVSKLYPMIRRRNFLKTAAALPFVDLYFGSAFAAAATYDYYVSPTGLASNAGTVSSPWNIGSLSTRPEIAGKRVGLLDGAYLVPNTYSDNWGGNPSAHGIHLTQAGTAATPTTIEAVNPGAVTLSGESSVNFSLITIDCAYVKISGITFDSKSFAAIRMWGNYGVIDSCDFLPIYSGTINDNIGAIYFKAKGADPVQSPVIRNCNFRGIYNVGQSYGSNAMAIMGFSVANLLMEYCTATNCFGLFRAKYDWFGYTIRNNFCNNTANFIENLCVPATYTGRVQIYNNLANCASGSYVYVSTEKCADADIFNNTIIVPALSGTAAAFRWWKLLGEAANTSRFYNNIVDFRSVTSTSQPTHVIGGTSGVLFDQVFQSMNFNCYGLASGGTFAVREGDLYSPSRSWSGMSAWQAASGFEANSIQSNPAFVDPAGSSPASFQLATNSPCRGAGRVGGVASGAAVDMGCWTQGVTSIGSSIGQAVRVPSIPTAPNLSSVT